MTTAEAIYELVSQLPEAKAQLVWTFAQFVQQQGMTSEINISPENSPHNRVIPPGTLTGLLGIAKISDRAPDDDDVLDDYTDYLIQKYQ